MKARLVFSVFVFFLGLVFVLGPSSLAGEKDKKKESPFDLLPKPGPEHKMLATFAGAWNAKVKAYFGPTPDESTGVMNRTMIMGGRYLREDYTGKVAGKGFSGLGIVGFDAAKKKYVFTWIDSMGTGIALGYGDYDAAKKTITYAYEDLNPFSGKTTKARDVLTIVSDTEQTLNMYRQEGGEEKKVLEIVYARVPKKDVKKDKK